MKNNFWQNLNKPFYALAPMAGISDAPFRQICKGFGADVLYSEMASATALFYFAKKRHNTEVSETLALLRFSESERPYVVQLFGSEPEHFKVAAAIISEKGIPCFEGKKRLIPDGIDINFGCPVKKVTKQGAGAALMADLEKSYAVIRAVAKETDLPVSIKVRLQSGNVDVLTFLDRISDLDVKAVMIHGRTVGQMFSGPIDCDAIRKSRDIFSGIIMANGGISDFSEAQRVLELTGADGLGVGRGVLGHPWIFSELRNKQSVRKEKNAIFRIALEHAAMAERLKGRKGLIEMRKHLCWYVSGLTGAARIREELIKIERIEDIERILKIYDPAS